MLLFLGLALVVPGRIEIDTGKVISAKGARLSGGFLLLFLPVAVIMHFVWQRPDWRPEMTLANAQWSAFGALVTIAAGIIGWSLYQSTKAAEKERLLKKSMFEEVRDDEPALEENVTPPQHVLPPPPPPKQHKNSKSNDAPFDFS